MGPIIFDLMVLFLLTYVFIILPFTGWWIDKKHEKNGDVYKKINGKYKWVTSK